MKRTAIIVGIILLLAGGVAIATQGWRDNQDAQQFSLTNLSQLGVGTVAPSASTIASFSTPSASPELMLLSNSSSSTHANAGIVVQSAAGIDTPLTAPYVVLSQQGTNYIDPVPAVNPFFTSNSGVVGYLGSGPFVIDVAGFPIATATPRMIIDTRDATGKQLERVGMDYSGNIQLDTLAGTGVRCMQVDASGNVSAPSPCGSGSGTVTSVTGTAQHVSVSPTTINPVVDLIGGFVSGDVVAGAQDLGLLSTGIPKINVTAGVASFSDAAAGTDYQAPMSAADGTVVFPTATTIRRAAVTGDCAIAAASNTCTVANLGKAWVDAADAANNSPDYLAAKILSSATVAVTPIGSNDQQLQLSVPIGAGSQTMFWSWNLLTALALNNQFMCEGNYNTGHETCNQYPALQGFSHVTMSLNITTNTCTGVGTPFFSVNLMKNGSIITNTPINCGTTGLVSVGTVTFSASAGDLVGLVYDGTSFGTGVGGGTSAFVTTRFDP